MTQDQANLDRRLDAVRLRWLRRDAVLAVARIVLLTLPVLLVLAWIDWRFHFSRGVRVVQLGAIVYWVGRVAYRIVLPAMRARRDAYTAALQVESICSRFGGRLVSRVEFAQGLCPPEVSAELVEASCRRVEQAAQDVDFGTVVDMRAVRAPAAGAALVLLLVLAVAATRADLAGIWLQRTFLPLGDAAWPQRTHITGVPATYRVRRGDPVNVKGRLTGEIARTGRMGWQSTADSSSGDQRGQRAFDVGTDGSFEVEIGPLLQPIALSIEAGDARLADIQVDVVRPPELASVEAVYAYPAFTRRQPDRVQSGDVRAIVGTRVELSLTADRPTQRMSLEFQHDDGGTVEQVQQDSPLHGTASFVVMRRGLYKVRLSDSYGFSTDSPSVFVIDPIDNALPTVRLMRPGSEHMVTPATTLRLRFEADDDFGVTAAAIRWRKRTPEDTADKDVSSLPIPPPTAGEKWDGRFGWELAVAGFTPGDEVEYHIEVSDSGEHLTARKTGISRTQVLKVVSPDALRRSLETRQRDAYAELDQLLKQQQAGRDAVTLAIVSLTQREEPLTTADLQRVQTERHRQGRLVRQAERIAAALEDIADELADSYLADEKAIANLRTTAKGLHDLRAGPMQEAAVRIEQALTALGSLTEPAKAREP